MYINRASSTKKVLVKILCLSVRVIADEARSSKDAVLTTTGKNSSVVVDSFVLFAL